MIQSFWLWFRQTSTLIGIPVTFLVIMVMGQKFLFTTTCEIAGWRCEYSLRASGDSGLGYVAGLLDGAIEDSEPPILYGKGKK